jgi:hypothetical protein
VKREDASTFTNKANGMCIKGKKICVDSMAKGAGGKGRAEKAAAGAGRIPQNRDGAKGQQQGSSTPSNAGGRVAGHGYSELADAAQAGGPPGARQGQGKKQAGTKTQNGAKAPQQGAQGASKQARKDQSLSDGAEAPKGNQQSAAEQVRNEANKKKKEAPGKIGIKQKNNEGREDSKTSSSRAAMGNAASSDIGLGEVYRAFMSGASMLDEAEETIQTVGPGHFVGTFPIHPHGFQNHPVPPAF